MWLLTSSFDSGAGQPTPISHPGPDPATTMTSPTTTTPNPEEELARFDRQRWATAAKANVELEGFVASQEFEQLNARYIAGEISTADMLRWLDERHPDKPAV
jgi:hypothetical protein